MRKTHAFNNGVVVYDHHLLEVQRQRYAKRNVHEAEEEDVFIQIIKDLPSGGCYINIGTAIGYYPILARKLRKDLRIHCFEPLPRHLRYFRENIRLNGLREEDFTVHALAVAPAAGKVTFQDQSYSSVIVDGQPRFSLKRFIQDTAQRIAGKPAQGSRFSVNAIALTDIFTVVKSDCIDFLQMDIQGFEQPVLQQYFTARDRNSKAIHAFLVGTHGAEIHRTCADLFADSGYSLPVDNRDTKEQPDGILYARLGASRVHSH